MNQYHKSVLLGEVIDFLQPKPGKLYIDATIGGGGHSFELLKYGAKVLGIDRDPEAIEHVEKEVISHKSKVRIGKDLILVNGNFNKIGEIAKFYGFTKVDGIVFDLGVSSHQLETVQRGFSFNRAGPLDMRMDPSIAVKASDIINNFDQRRLNEIFKDFAQEQFSWRVASAISSARQIKPIETTVELAQIVEDARGRARNKTFEVKKRKRHVKGTGLHPATKVFLALRIVVNSELLNLEEALPQTIDLLKSNGRLVVISFHSVEEGIVKRFFKKTKELKILNQKPIPASVREVRENPRARSAGLRAAEKI